MLRFGCMLVLCVALMGLAGLAAAESPRPEGVAGKVEGDADAKAAAGAAVVFHNRTVFVMRGTLLGYPPAERAKRAEERLAEVLERGGAAEITTKMTAEGAAIFVGGALVFLVTPGDVDHLAGETLESTVASVVGNLSQAIDETREGRDLRRLVTGLAKSLAATVVFGLLLWLLVRANGWLGARISAARSRSAHREAEGGRHDRRAVW